MSQPHCSGAKEKQIRLCIDMRAPNGTIQCVRHLMPTVEDVKVESKNAKYFTKLDLKEAYHQLVLHPNSRYITIFSTCSNMHYKKSYQVSRVLSILQMIFLFMDSYVLNMVKHWGNAGRNWNK